MHQLTINLVGIEKYLDDLLVNSEDCKKHLHRLRIFLKKLANNNLIINLAKRELARERITHLGFIVGQS